MTPEQGSAGFSPTRFQKALFKLGKGDIVLALSRVGVKHWFPFTILTYEIQNRLDSSIRDTLVKKLALTPTLISEIARTQVVYKRNLEKLATFRERKPTLPLVASVRTITHILRPAFGGSCAWFSDLIRRLHISIDRTVADLVRRVSALNPSSRHVAARVIVRAILSCMGHPLCDGPHTLPLGLRSSGNVKADVIVLSDCTLLSQEGAFSPFALLSSIDSSWITARCASEIPTSLGPVAVSLMWFSYSGSATGNATRGIRQAAEYIVQQLLMRPDPARPFLFISEGLAASVAQFFLCHTSHSVETSIATVRKCCLGFIFVNTLEPSQAKVGSSLWLFDACHLETDSPLTSAVVVANIASASMKLPSLIATVGVQEEIPSDKILADHLAHQTALLLGDERAGRAEKDAADAKDCPPGTRTASEKMALPAKLPNLLSLLDTAPPLFQDGVNAISKLLSETIFKQARTDPGAAFHQPSVQLCAVLDMTDMSSAATFTLNPPSLLKAPPLTDQNQAIICLRYAAQSIYEHRPRTIQVRVESGHFGKQQFANIEKLLSRIHKGEFEKVVRRRDKTRDPQSAIQQVSEFFPRAALPMIEQLGTLSTALTSYNRAIQALLNDAAKTDQIAPPVVPIKVVLPKLEKLSHSLMIPMRTEGMYSILEEQRPFIEVLRELQKQIRERVQVRTQHDRVMRIPKVGVLGLPSSGKTYMYNSLFMHAGQKKPLLPVKDSVCTGSNIEIKFLTDAVLEKAKRLIEAQNQKLKGDEGMAKFCKGVAAFAAEDEDALDSLLVFEIQYTPHRRYQALRREVNKKFKTLESSLLHAGALNLLRRSALAERYLLNFEKERTDSGRSSSEPSDSLDLSERKEFEKWAREYAEKTPIKKRISTKFNAMLDPTPSRPRPSQPESPFLESNASDPHTLVDAKLTEAEDSADAASWSDMGKDVFPTSAEGSPFVGQAFSSDDSESESYSSSELFVPYTFAGNEKDKNPYVGATAAELETAVNQLEELFTFQTKLENVARTFPNFSEGSYWGVGEEEFTSLTTGENSLFLDSINLYLKAPILRLLTLCDLPGLEQEVNGPTQMLKAEIRKERLIRALLMTDGMIIVSFQSELGALSRLFNLLKDEISEELLADCLRKPSILVFTGVDALDPDDAWNTIQEARKTALATITQQIHGIDRIPPFVISSCRPFVQFLQGYIEPITDIGDLQEEEIFSLHHRRLNVVQSIERLVRLISGRWPSFDTGVLRNVKGADLELMRTVCGVTGLEGSIVGLWYEIVLLEMEPIICEIEQIVHSNQTSILRAQLDAAFFYELCTSRIKVSQVINFVSRMSVEYLRLDPRTRINLADLNPEDLSAFCPNSIPSEFDTICRRISAILNAQRSTILRRVREVLDRYRSHFMTQYSTDLAALAQFYDEAIKVVAGIVSDELDPNFLLQTLLALLHKLNDTSNTGVVELIEQLFLDAVNDPKSPLNSKLTISMTPTQIFDLSLAFFSNYSGGESVDHEEKSRFARFLSTLKQTLSPNKRKKIFRKALETVCNDLFANANVLLTRSHALVEFILDQGRQHLATITHDMFSYSSRLGRLDKKYSVYGENTDQRTLAIQREFLSRTLDLVGEFSLELVSFLSGFRSSITSKAQHSEPSTQQISVEEDPLTLLSSAFQFAFKHLPKHMREINSAVESSQLHREIDTDLSFPLHCYANFFSTKAATPSTLIQLSLKGASFGLKAYSFFIDVSKRLQSTAEELGFIFFGNRAALENKDQNGEDVGVARATAAAPRAESSSSAAGGSPEDEMAVIPRFVTPPNSPMEVGIGEAPAQSNGTLLMELLKHSTSPGESDFNFRFPISYPVVGDAGVEGRIVPPTAARLNLFPESMHDVRANQALVSSFFGDNVGHSAPRWDQCMTLLLRPGNEMTVHFSIPSSSLPFIHTVTLLTLRFCFAGAERVREHPRTPVKPSARAESTDLDVKTPLVQGEEGSSNSSEGGAPPEASAQGDSPKKELLHAPKRQALFGNFERTVNGMKIVGRDGMIQCMAPFFPSVEEGDSPQTVNYISSLFLPRDIFHDIKTFKHSFFPGTLSFVFESSVDGATHQLTIPTVIFLRRSGEFARTRVKSLCLAPRRFPLISINFAAHRNLGTSNFCVLKKISKLLHARVFPADAGGEQNVDEAAVVELRDAVGSALTDEERLQAITVAGDLVDGYFPFPDVRPEAALPLDEFLSASFTLSSKVLLHLFVYTVMAAAATGDAVFTVTITPESVAAGKLPTPAHLLSLLRPAVKEYALKLALLVAHMLFDKALESRFIAACCAALCAFSAPHLAEPLHVAIMKELLQDEGEKSREVQRQNWSAIDRNAERILDEVRTKMSDLELQKLDLGRDYQRMKRHQPAGRATALVLSAKRSGADVAKQLSALVASYEAVLASAQPAAARAAPGAPGKAVYIRSEKLIPFFRSCKLTKVVQRLSQFSSPPTSNEMQQMLGAIFEETRSIFQHRQRLGDDLAAFLAVYQRLLTVALRMYAAAFEAHFSGHKYSQVWQATVTRAEQNFRTLSRFTRMHFASGENKSLFDTPMQLFMSFFKAANVEAQCWPFARE
eukprot:gnl/Chilomastix_cuspidata/2039.p1 GENE.gnl/Chilomastix_cuspidata/2039~~gnl/Chilomastix_cuspidata/2039.p1  ORF type:complete len:2576 (-),score=1213.37 gnl/Chilomastix_cuspidata/2039:306-8033(-)